MQSLRIAQVAPLAESVPPRLYGGTERVVSFLTEELIAQGHAVTLFASGDSRTTATLIAGCPRALRSEAAGGHIAAYETLQLEQVISRADDFDILHFHIDPVQFPLIRRCRTPSVTTLHGRLDLPNLRAVFGEFRETPLVSISDAQRSPLPDQNWAATVYHGLPPRLLPYTERPGDYLAFLGRVAPEKGIDRAIQIARECERPLRIAAKVDPSDRVYFEKHIAPMLTSADVEFIGEIGERGKAELLGGARALLFPIDWPEPFGLVMIESLACGTPVIATRRGSVPEVIEDGVTGFIVDDAEHAAPAVRRIGELDRRACREAFERRFSAARMARDYLGVYESLMVHHGNRRAG